MPQARSTPPSSSAGHGERSSGPGSAAVEDLLPHRDRSQGGRRQPVQADGVADAVMLLEERLGRRPLANPVLLPCPIEVDGVAHHALLSTRRERFHKVAGL